MHKGISLHRTLHRIFLNEGFPFIWHPARPTGLAGSGVCPPWISKGRLELYMSIYLSISTYLYVYVCIHIYIYIHNITTHTYTNVCIIHMYIHMYIYIYIHICMYIHICIYIYIHMYVYLHIYVSLSLYIYIYIHTYTYVYIYIYIHTCVARRGLKCLAGGPCGPGPARRARKHILYIILYIHIISIYNYVAYNTSISIIIGLLVD